MNALLKVLIAITGVTLSPPGLTQVPQKFPSKPIRMLVAYGPGGESDILARMIGEKMSEHWGQAVVLDHRPGAGGMLAAIALVKAAPDGYTLLWDGGQFSISAAMQPNLPYDPLKDFASVTRIGFSANVLVVAPSLGVKSVKDLIALAKAQPGKMIFGSSGAGTPNHLKGARFNLAAGIKVVTVAFQGSAMIETLAGRTHYSAVTLSSALPYIQQGTLLALGVFTPHRSPVLPDVPSISETLPEFKRDDGGHGLLTRAGTPRPILNQISKEVARILELADIQARLRVFGMVAAPNTPEEQDQARREHIEMLTKLVADAGLKAK